MPPRSRAPSPPPSSTNVSASMRPRMPVRVAAKSRPAISTFAPESATWYAISSGVKRALSGTTVAPAFHAPNIASRSVGPLYIIRATRSPRWTPRPEASALARASARRFSSRYVLRPPPSSQTRAVVSGCTRADPVRMSPRFIGDGSAHGLENARRHPGAVEAAQRARRHRRRHRAHVTAQHGLAEKAEVLLGGERLAMAERLAHRGEADGPRPAVHELVGAEGLVEPGLLVVAGAPDDDRHRLVRAGRVHGVERPVDPLVLARGHPRLDLGGHLG